MNKAELIEAVAERSEVAKKDAEAVVDAVFDIIVETVDKGETVKISRFGIFEKKARAARTGTNPSSGKAIEIPASNSIGFKVSKSLKEKLN